WRGGGRGGGGRGGGGGGGGQGRWGGECQEAKRARWAVSRFLSRTAIPLAPPLLAGSSNRPGSIRRAVLLPYLVLLRAGFCLPPMSPPARCALTAPFHPYLLRQA